MRIKNAFKILISNSILIYKSMIYKLVTTSVIGLIAYFIIQRDVEHILYSSEVNAFWNAIIDTLTGFVKGNGLNTDIVPQTFDAVLSMLKANASTITVSFFKVGLCVYVLNVVERMGNYAIGVLTDKYMSALSKYSLVSTLLANIGRAFIYSIIIVPLAMMFDGLVVVLGILIAVYGIRVFSIFAVIIALMFVVIALSCKYTLLLRFMPQLITDKAPIGKAFRNCFAKREKFFAMVGNYAFVVMISFYLNVSVAVFTLGAGLIISIPLTSLFPQLVAFVDHYQLSGKRYYVSGEEVVTPRQVKKHNELLKYM